MFPGFPSQVAPIRGVFRVVENFARGAPHPTTSVLGWLGFNAPKVVFVGFMPHINFGRIVGFVPHACLICVTGFMPRDGL